MAYELLADLLSEDKAKLASSHWHWHWHWHWLANLAAPGQVDCVRTLAQQAIRLGAPSNFSTSNRSREPLAPGFESETGPKPIRGQASRRVLNYGVHVVGGGGRHHEVRVPEMTSCEHD